MIRRKFGFLFDLLASESYCCGGEEQLLLIPSL